MFRCRWCYGLRWHVDKYAGVVVCVRVPGYVVAVAGSGAGGTSGVDACCVSIGVGGVGVYDVDVV